MFSLLVRFIQKGYYEIMNNSREITLNEPLKLMRRLKIVHSYSANVISNNNISNSPSNNNNSILKDETKMIRLNQSATQKPRTQSISSNQSILLNPNKGLLSISKTNSQEINKNKSVIKYQGTKGLNKINQRSFSTLGRFLSTPSGTNSQEFLLELSEAILTNKIKKIVIMAGAGISCPSGIPDFRTPGSGLYDNVQQYKIPYPEAIFDINYFMTNPKPFFTLAKELFPSGKYRPNKVHYFFKLLQDKKLLLRVYTQNIDGLERLAGVTDTHLVEAHGTFASATCTRCGESYGGDYIKTCIDQNDTCRCLKCKGVVKPDIVFFGEDLPSRFHLYSSDFRQADLLLVMGTSLEVEPFASIVDSIRFGVPRVLLNRQAVGVFRSKRRISDNCLLGDITESIDTLVKVLRWESDLANVTETGEKNKISFLDTISKVKPGINVRNFSTFANMGRRRPPLLPPVRVRSNYREDTIEDSSESDDTTSDSDSSSS